MPRRRILHAIHDFLPRHRAGSEIYAAALAGQQAGRHDVFVLAAEYDPGTPHGTLRWRACGDLPVIELVNNWEFRRFEETYRSPRLNAQLTHVLEATRPDVLHVHNLLNLSLDLPRLASERGIRTVATLHDYTMVCPSGGQRVHVAEAHVCETIEPARCSRCYSQSPFHAQMAASRLLRPRPAARAAGVLKRLLPVAAGKAAGRLPFSRVSEDDIRRRLAYARPLFDTVDLFVAPSAALADEYVRLGLDRRRIEVSDYGFEPVAGSGRVAGAARELSFGFVGTLVWHKGAHLLIEAARLVRGRFRIRIFGDPTTFPAYAHEQQQRAAGLPISFEGGFERAALSEVYSGFDVLVVPSLWPENSPLVIHEAFMHGRAVVAARLGGIPGLLAEGAGGLLFDAGSAADLARAMQRLVDDPSLVARLAAHHPAVKSIAEDAREWDRRYEEVLCDRPVVVA